MQNELLEKIRLASILDSREKYLFFVCIEDAIKNNYN